MFEKRIDQRGLCGGTPSHRLGWPIHVDLDMEARLGGSAWRGCYSIVLVAITIRCKQNESLCFTFNFQSSTAESRCLCCILLRNEPRLVEVVVVAAFPFFGDVESCCC